MTMEKLTTLATSPTIRANDYNFLAKHYELSPSAEWCLHFNGEVYTLSCPSRHLSLCLDFRAGNYRHRQANPSKEPLVNAIKIKKKLPKTLFDTTPGVLKDSLMLAARGVCITAVERNPLLFVMVNQALSLLPASVCLDYHFGNSCDFLGDCMTESIYVDPMYPQPKKHRAKVKKDMQILHHLVGADDDADRLFTRARQQPARVVVKRPSYAKPLGGEAPNFVSQTGATRFDVYLPRK